MSYLGILIIAVLLIGFTYWFFDSAKQRAEEEKEEIQKKEEQEILIRHKLLEIFNKGLDELERQEPRVDAGKSPYSRNDWYEDIKIREFRQRVIDFKNGFQAQFSVLLFNNKYFFDSDYHRYYSILDKYKTNDIIDAEREEERQRATIKKKEEAEQRQTRKNKFSYIMINGYDAAYRYDYYPLNRYPSVDYHKERERKEIWSFKNGHDEIGYSIISDYLLGNYSPEEIKGLTICVIPASTRSKNEIRYKLLCENLSKNLSIQNGYDLISILWDRPNTRGQKVSDTTINLSFLSSIKGRDIILFDDITTRGTSFTQIADILKAKGARSIKGLFLGKTV